LTHPDGTIEERTTKSRALAVWDAKQTVEKLRVSNGKSQSIGIVNADQEASSTNTVVALQALVELLKLLPK